MPIPAETRALIIEAVRSAAKTEIRPRFRSLNAADVAQKSARDDLVTAADLAVEKALRTAFAGLMPDTPIVGEEGVAEDAAQLDLINKGGRVIVIDPIDGTWNFAQGMPTFGTMVSVIEDGETVFGLLYEPMLDDWVWAAKGDGTWSGTERLQLPPPGSFETLTALLGFYGMDLDQWAQVAALYPRFLRVSDSHASIMDYRLLSRGQAAFKLNRQLNVWDHAAGVLCLREAGGHAALLDGTPYAPSMRKGRLLTAQSEALWHELAAILRPIFASA
ncbi:inositol monophosphatase family protein [Shimia ponticola]|uniref:inositol monophosphatase family protein n=1 Tax=Shimia ponticola TaxID=2582893 RepID=UPI0011BE65D8|nr:inositol monophosphatase [Shimia ponticola]